jgi:hypothetical protein
MTSVLRLRTRKRFDTHLIRGTYPRHPGCESKKKYELSYHQLWPIQQRLRQICNRSRQFQHIMMPPCRWVQLAHGLMYQTIPRFIQLAKLPDFCHAHIEIAIVPVPARDRRCPTFRSGLAAVLASPTLAPVSKQTTRPSNRCSVFCSLLRILQLECRFYRVGIAYSFLILFFIKKSPS